MIYEQILIPSLPTECSRRGVKKRRVGCPDTLKNMAALLELLQPASSTPSTNVHRRQHNTTTFPLPARVTLVHQQPRVGECRRNVKQGRGERSARRRVCDSSLTVSCSRHRQHHEARKIHTLSSLPPFFSFLGKRLRDSHYEM